MRYKSILIVLFALFSLAFLACGRDPAEKTGSSPAAGDKEPAAGSAVQPGIPAQPKENKANNPSQSPVSSGTTGSTAPVKPGTSPAPDNKTLDQRYLRSGQAGRVNVSVLWLSPEYVNAEGNPFSQINPEKNLTFMISMTTHSGDLLQYDLAKMAVLQAGGQTITPLGWEFTSKDSHHPEGVLLFPGPASAAGSTQMTLVIKGLGGSQEVSFKW